jgi:hypothetical protein
MNRQIRSTLSALALATLAFAATPAQADDGIAVRVATGVGRVIASQGNAALITIREEIKAKLVDSLSPFLPADPAGDAQKSDEHDASAPTL